MVDNFGYRNQVTLVYGHDIQLLTECSDQEAMGMSVKEYSEQREKVLKDHVQVFQGSDCGWSE